MESKTLKIVVQESNLPEEDKQILVSGFESAEKLAQEWKSKAEKIVVKSKDDVEAIAQAKHGRKLLKEKRIEVDKTRIRLKEQSLRKTQAIDAVARYLTSLITPIEEYLELQEKFVENQLEQEAKELEEKRLSEMGKYTENLSIYNFRLMTEEAYQEILKNAKKVYEDRVAEEERLEALRVEREKEEKLEQERIRKENEKLRKEAEEKDRILEKERKEREQKALAEAKKRKELEDKLERQKKEKEAQEKRVKDEALQKKQEEERIEREKKLAPDKEKLKELSNRLMNFEYPEVSDGEAKKILNKVQETITIANKYIISNLNKL